MPELPEVEATRRRIATAWTNQTLTGIEVRDERLLTDAGQSLEEWRAAMVGQQVSTPQRRAKFLLVPLTGEHTMLIHLGMTGKLLDLDTQEEFATHLRLVWEFDHGQRWGFQDVRRFGQVRIVPTAELDALAELQKLGPDALHEPTDAERLAGLCARSRRSIKTLLMDQRALGGIGNIWASEILYRAHVAPARTAESLNREEVEGIAAAIVPALEWAIKCLMERKQPRYVGEPGFENPFPIYGREGEPCPSCGALIRRTVITGRSSYHCPVCQPE